jgi:hypothetical protein
MTAARRPRPKGDRSRCCGAMSGNAWRSEISTTELRQEPPLAIVGPDYGGPIATGQESLTQRHDKAVIRPSQEPGGAGGLCQLSKGIRGPLAVLGALLTEIPVLPRERFDVASVRAAATTQENRAKLRMQPQHRFR